MSSDSDEDFVVRLNGNRRDLVASNKSPTCQISNDSRNEIDLLTFDDFTINSENSEVPEDNNNMLISSETINSSPLHVEISDSNDNKTIPGTPSSRQIIPIAHSTMHQSKSDFDHELFSISDIRSDSEETRKSSFSKQSELIRSADAASMSTQNSRDWRFVINKIQPVHTGAYGRLTFNRQKALAINRIEKLQSAMDSCPVHNELATQPNSLRTILIPHQLFALQWMLWRERGEPRGGLLSADLDFDKTSTVLSLVLETKNTRRLNAEGGTLIVCPASLITLWQQEVQNRVEHNKLSVVVYHGNSRRKNTQALTNCDLVITTYRIVSNEQKSIGALFNVGWHRIVLDEAHVLRSHNAVTAKACCELRSTIRWGLTGTSTQNTHMNVYLMLKFLRVTPFDDLRTFNRWMNSNGRDGRKLLDVVLRPMLLPEQKITIESLVLTPNEANCYTKILVYVQAVFAEYMGQHPNQVGNSRSAVHDVVKKQLEEINRATATHIAYLLRRLRSSGIAIRSN